MSIGCIQSSSSVGLLGHQSVTVWLLFRDLASAGLIPNNIQYTYICSFDWYCSFPYPIRWWSSNNGRTNRQMDGYDWGTDSRISYSDRHTHNLCMIRSIAFLLLEHINFYSHTTATATKTTKVKCLVLFFSNCLVFFHFSTGSSHSIHSSPVPHDDDDDDDRYKWFLVSFGGLPSSLSSILCPIPYWVQNTIKGSLV